MSSSVATPTRTRRQKAAAAAAASAAPEAPAKAAATPASKSINASARKKPAKCDQFRSLYTQATWFDREEVAGWMAASLDVVATGFNAHLDSGCGCSVAAFDQLVLASTYHGQFSLASQTSILELDAMMKRSELVANQSSSASASTSSAYKSDFDSNCSKDSKPASKLVTPPLTSPIKATHFGALIAPAVRSLAAYQAAFACDNEASPLNRLLITNSFVLDKLNGLFAVFTFYRLPQHAFSAASTALNYARRYYLELGQLTDQVPFTKACEEVLVATANMTSFLLANGFIEAAAAFLRRHCPQLSDFSVADIASINSYGQSLLFLLHLELQLRHRRYDKIAGMLEAFLAGAYVSLYTIKRYLVKIMALHLASRFPATQFKFTAFAEFVDAHNMTISVCKRWTIFDRFYPKSSSSSSSSTTTGSAGKSSSNPDALWIRFTTFSLLLETGPTCVQFYANAGQLMDAGFFFRVMRTLSVITINVDRLLSTLFMGAAIDLKGGYLGDARTKLAQALELFTTNRAAYQNGSSTDSANFELSTNALKSLICHYLPPSSSPTLAGTLRAKFDDLDSGSGSSLHRFSLFYAAFHLVALEQAIRIKQEEEEKANCESASAAASQVSSDLHQLLLSLECYTTKCHLPAIRKLFPVKESEESGLLLSVPTSQQLKTSMELALMHSGQCASAFWRVATFYLGQLAHHLPHQALCYLNKLCPIGAFSYEASQARCELFYLRSAIILRLLKPAIQNVPKSVLFNVASDVMLSSSSNSGLSGGGGGQVSLEASSSLTTVILTRMIATMSSISTDSSSGGANRGGESTQKCTTAKKYTSKKALFADDKQLQQQPGQADLPLITGAATGKESLESGRRIIAPFCEETQHQMQQVEQCTMVTPCSKKGGGQLVSAGATSLKRTAGALRHQRNTRLAATTSKMDIPVFYLDDDDDDDDVKFIGQKLAQQKVQSEKKMDASKATTSSSSSSTYLTVDLSSGGVAKMRAIYEEAMVPSKVASALKEARDCARKVSSYVGAFPSWRLSQQLHYLLFELTVADTSLGSFQPSQHQQVMTMMAYHLSESADHAAFRYRTLSIASRKAAKSSAGRTIGTSSSGNAHPLHFTPANYNSGAAAYYADSLPANWRFLQVKLLSNGTGMPDVLFGRLQPGQKQGHTPPVFFKASTANQTLMSKSFMAEFEEVMAGNSSSMALTDRTAYWARRHAIDGQLCRLLATFEAAFIGPFKGLLLGESTCPHYQTACRNFRAALEKAARKAGLPAARSPTLLEVFSESVLFLESDQQLVAGVKLLFGGWREDSTGQPSDPLKVVLLRRVHFKFWMTLGGEAYAERLEELGRTFAPVGIILDAAMAQFPFECLPTSRRAHQAHFRVPSVRVANLLYRQWCQQKQMQLAASSSSSQALTACRWTCQPRPSCFYLINPADNLSNTDKYFRSKFEILSCQEPSWEGLIGTEPNTAQLAACLTQKELYLYFGHGSGSIYYRKMEGGGLDGLPVPLRPASLVIGCSSGRVSAESALEGIYGVSYRFLANGAPAFVGALWDITDKDIDMYADQLLAYAVDLWPRPSVESGQKVAECSLPRALSKARDICKLKYLTGAAPVIYGLPIQCYTDLNKPSIVVP